ncbi:Plasma membrane fusion protein [Hirschfeldia incana]|nr:Plasma membrane fusion protein [Hirschfeldia incana]
MLCSRSTTVFILFSFLLVASVLSITEKETSVEEEWGTSVKERFMAEENRENSSLILAAKRTKRKDPTENFNLYTGGWNISNTHYWTSVAYTAVPFFAIAGVWFVVFGLSLSLICLCYCCCARQPYGYSRVAYALSLILLILFTIAAIVGCVFLYTGQGKFHASTTDTLDYVVRQANFTAENLRNVSDYLNAAKKVDVQSIVLPGDVLSSIDNIQGKINSSATTLSVQTMENQDRIQDVVDNMRLALIIIAAVMLFLAFIGFLLSIFGLQCLVYTLVILGWILVTGTFVLCGIFLLLHNVVGDTCVAMDQWVLNPTAHTALDDILPCVDNATATETLTQTKDVTYKLVEIVDNIINTMANKNFPPQARPFYYNQSGPLMPLLCNPFNADLSDHQCKPGEAHLSNATEVWKNYTCEIITRGTCSTPGRVTPELYTQLVAAVNVSYGLNKYGPFLADLRGCNFVRSTFTDIERDHCPGLRRYTQWIYVGLVLVSAAVMLSLVFWVIYARERRHRVYTKDYNAMHSEAPRDKGPQ